jgi:hypothetical protein
MLVSFNDYFEKYILSHYFVMNNLCDLRHNEGLMSAVSGKHCQVKKAEYYVYAIVEFIPLHFTKVYKFSFLLLIALW